MTTPPLTFDPIEEAARQWRAHGWHEAADGMAAVTSLMRAQAIMLARAEEALRPLGLSFARYELLTLLSFTRSGALPMARAGALLQVHPTSITNAVHRLERAGLVRREPHPDDGRAVLVRITDEGIGFDFEALAPLDPSAPNFLGCPRGHGLLLMRGFMTEVQHHGRGNIVTMSKVR